MANNITGISGGLGLPKRFLSGEGEVIPVPPSLKEKLVCVVSSYGKSNSDPDRDIIRDQTGNGNDFYLKNFKFSPSIDGYGGKLHYDWTTWKSDKVISGQAEFKSKSPEKVVFTNITTRTLNLYSSAKRLAHQVTFRVSGIQDNTIANFHISIKNTDDLSGEYVGVYSGKGNGIHTVDIPESTIIAIGIQPVLEGATEFPNEVSVEHLPQREEGLVTDGVEDLILSKKPVTEMLGGSRDITVISMIKQVKKGSGIIRNNFIGYPIEGKTFWIDNKVSGDGDGKTGIYGYTITDLSGTTSNLEKKSILGDTNDYTSATNTDPLVFDEFSVSGYRNNRSTGITIEGTSQIIWYWTFIAKGILTDSEIEEVIKCYNLDRPGEVIKPILYYDNYKQGMTNLNHSTKFSDTLVDLMGSGKNAKITGMAFSGGSGISRYKENFNLWKKDTSASQNFTTTDSSVHFHIERKDNGRSIYGLIYFYPSQRNTDIPEMEVDVNIITPPAPGTRGLMYRYFDNTAKLKELILQPGRQVLPQSYLSLIPSDNPGSNWVGLYASEGSEAIITQVPEYSESVIFDGVDDCAEVSSLPVLKDYTVAAYRNYIDLPTGTVFGLASKRLGGEPDGAFILEQHNSDGSTTTYSFGKSTNINNLINRGNDLVWQSKYSYCGSPITAGSLADTESLFIGARGNHFGQSNIRLTAFLLWPYSLPKFLLYRQLDHYGVAQKVWKTPEVEYNIPGYTGIDRIEYYRHFPTESGINNEVEKLIPGTKYTPSDDTIEVRLYLKSGDEIVNITYDGSYFPSIYPPGPDHEYYSVVGVRLGNKVGKLKIEIGQQYARFEDILNPYPLLATEYTDTSGNIYRTGDLIPIGTVLKYPSFLGSFPYSVFSPAGNVRYNDVEITDTAGFTFTVTKDRMEFSNPIASRLSGAVPVFCITPTVKKDYITNQHLKSLGYFPDLTGAGHNLNLSMYDWNTGAGITWYTSPVSSETLPGFNWCPGKSGMGTIQGTTRGIQTLVIKLCLKKDISVDLFSQENGMHIVTSGRTAYSDSKNILLSSLLIDDSENAGASMSDLVGSVHTLVVKCSNDVSNRDLGKIMIGISGSSDVVIHYIMGFDYDLTPEDTVKINTDMKSYGDYVLWNPKVNIISNSGNITPIVKSVLYGEYLEPGYIFPKRSNRYPFLEVEFPRPLTIINSATCIDRSKASNSTYTCNIYKPGEVNSSGVTNKSAYYIKMPDGSEDNNLVSFNFDLAVTEYMAIEYVDQPYPYFVEFYSGNTKLRQSEKIPLGSQVKISLSNRMSGLYEATGFTLNGQTVADGDTVTVTRDMTFRCTDKRWLLNTVSEPLWAYEAALISEETMLYLGHLPDLTGNGRHMKLHGFQKGMAQAKDDYRYNFTSPDIPSGVEVLYSSIGEVTIRRPSLDVTEKILTLYDPYGPIEINFSSPDVEIISGTARIDFFNSAGTVLKTIPLVSGHNIIEEYQEPDPNTTTVSDIFLIVTVPGTFTIRQKGRRHGSLRFMSYGGDIGPCYGEIPGTTTEYLGCVAGRIFFEENSGTILDQVGTGDVIRLKPDASVVGALAYTKDNPGRVWISNTPNSYVLDSDLPGEQHNFSVTLENPGSPIGEAGLRFSCGLDGTGDCTTNLYSLIGFPDTPSDFELGIINTWTGIEASVELPQYYWDVAGKNNVESEDIDQKRATIYNQVPVQIQNETPLKDALTLNGFAFTSMSGYGGYTFPDFSRWTLSSGNTNITLTLRTPYWVSIVNNSDTDSWGWYNQVSLADSLLDVSGKLKLIAYQDLEFIVDLKYSITGVADKQTLRVYNKTLVAEQQTTLEWTYKTQAEIDALDAVADSMYYIVYFNLLKDVEYMIEMLPEYQNGLIFDGVDDEMSNPIIPAMTDYTILVNRETFPEQGTMTCLAHKGIVPTTAGDEFIIEYNPSVTSSGSNTVMSYSFGKYTYINSGIPDLYSKTITYQTTESYDGIVIQKGDKLGQPGIRFGRWSTTSGGWKGVFYKAMLYSKTIPDISIKLLKNLLAIPNYIVNLQNPIFIPYVDKQPDPDTPVSATAFKGFLTTYPRTPQAGKVSLVVTEDSFQVTSIVGTNSFFLERLPTDILVDSYNISVTGLNDAGLRLVVRTLREDATMNDTYITKDGLYTVPISKAVSDNMNIGYRLLNLSSWGNVDVPTCNVVVTWIK